MYSRFPQGFARYSAEPRCGSQFADSNGSVRCGCLTLILLRCGAVRCGAVRCGAVRCGAVRCGAMRYGNGTVRCGSGVFLTGCAYRIARSNTFFKPTASPTTPAYSRSHPTKLRCWLDCYRCWCCSLRVSVAHPVFRPPGTRTVIRWQQRLSLIHI